MTGLSRRLFRTDDSLGRRSLRALFRRLLLVACVAASNPSTDASAPPWYEHELPSPHLGTSGFITVRVPAGFTASQTARYPVLYLLPVGTKREEATTALRALEQSAVADRFIIVMPWFDTTPWYANHRDDLQRQHERHLLEVVIPFIDQNYPTLSSAAGRSLLGFSKSGWGAFSLIFRHPELFGFAASWDAPLGLRDAEYGIWDTAAQTGSLECFHAFHPWRLMEQHAEKFRDHAPRLVLAGSALFGPGPKNRYANAPHTQATHARLEALRIPHRYLPDLHSKHAWSSGWLGAVAAALLELQERPPGVSQPRM